MAGERSRVFSIRDCLGQGGFGDVYRATMMSPGGLRSEVAIKVLREPGSDALVRLRDEGKLLALLRHPAILRVHDLTSLAGRISLVTEFIEGMDLGVAFAHDPPLSHRAVVEAIGVVAEALHAAWATTPSDSSEPLHLVHRDVKPSNLRLGRHGEMKILDFGIAWSADQDREAQTRGTAMIGSLPYMAPERFGRSAARPAGDVYGLGCTLFEGLAGRRLHADASLLEMGKRAGSAAVHDAHVAAAMAELDLSTDLRELLAATLAYDDEARPTAADVAQRCEALADRMEGGRLKHWCREVDWSNLDTQPGPLSGHTITDSTLDLPDGFVVSQPIDLPDSVTVTAGSFTSAESDTWAMSQALSPPSETGTSTRKLPILPIVGVAMVAMMATAGAAWQLSGATDESALPRVAPNTRDTTEAATAPDTEPVPPASAPPALIPEPIAEEAPDTQPVDAGGPAMDTPRRPPRTTPVADPDPPVVEPDPPPVEPPSVEPVPTPGTVSVTGDISKVQLRGEAGTFSPGAVPAGTYRIHADFGDGAWTDGQNDLRVRSGGRHVLRCNGVRWLCEEL
jgi:serine/threonine-protein kinase